MYSRVVPEGRAWRDGINYSDTEEMLNKAKSVLYGEGRGRLKSVPNTVLVGRHSLNENYNVLYFGSEMDDRSQLTYDCRDLFGDLWCLIIKSINHFAVLMDFHLGQTVDGYLVFTAKYRVDSQVYVSSKKVSILGNKRAYTVTRTDFLSQTSVKGVVEELNQQLDDIITRMLNLIMNESYVVSEVSFYGLNPLSEVSGPPKVYRGIGQALYCNYPDLYMEEQGAYRLGIFLEVY